MTTNLGPEPGLGLTPAPTFRQFVDAEHQRLRGEYGCTWAEAREYRPDDTSAPTSRCSTLAPGNWASTDALTDIDGEARPGLPQGYAIRRRSRAARPHATTGAQR
jgi:hypothetical protein